jgi:hypothetical protein
MSSSEVTFNWATNRACSDGVYLRRGDAPGIVLVITQVTHKTILVITQVTHKTILVITQVTYKDDSCHYPGNIQGRFLANNADGGKSRRYMRGIRDRGVLRATNAGRKIQAKFNARIIST